MYNIVAMAKIDATMAPPGRAAPPALFDLLHGYPGAVLLPLALWATSALHTGMLKRPAPRTPLVMRLSTTVAFVRSPLSLVLTWPLAR